MKKEFEKKIKKCEEICLSVFEELGLKPRAHTYRVRSLSKEMGTCTLPEDDSPCEITLDRVLFESYQDESFLLGTMGHELLHASLENDLSYRGGHSEEFMEFTEKLYDRGIYANLTYRLNVPIKVYKGEKAKVCRCDCGSKIAFIDSRAGICPICGKKVENKGGHDYVPSLLV